MNLISMPYVMVDGEETRIDNLIITGVETLCNGRQLVFFTQDDGSKGEGYLV